MDKPFNHLIICLTFVMPVAALSGCSGPNDSPEQDAVMSISSCTARGDDGQEMSVSEFGMFVTDTAGNLYPDNIRVLNRSGKWTFAEISLSDGDKGIYAYYPYSPSCSGGKMGLDARSQTDYLYSERTMVSGNAPSASITLYHLLSKVTFRMPAAVTAVRVADYSYSASYSLLTGSLEIKPEKAQYPPEQEAYCSIPVTVRPCTWRWWPADIHTTSSCRRRHSDPERNMSTL